MVTNFWGRLLTPLRMMQACSIVLAVILTVWCVHNNIDPDIAMQPQRHARMDYDVSVAKFESAKKNLEALDKGLEAIGNDHMIDAKDWAKKVPNPTARIRLTTLATIIDTLKQQRREVFGKYGVLWAEDQREACWLAKGCYEALVTAEQGFVTRAGYNSNSLIGAYLSHVRQLRSDYKETIDASYGLKWGECTHYPDRCKKRGEEEARQAAKKKQRADEYKAAQAFDTAYAKADLLGKLGLFLWGVAKLSWQVWAWSFAAIVVCGVFISLAAWAEFGRKSLIRGAYDGNKRVVDVIIPRLPFLRPKLIGHPAKGWKVSLNWRGKTVLRDRLGNQMVADENADYSFFQMVMSADLPSYLGTTHGQNDALDHKIREQDEEIVRLKGKAQQSSEWATRSYEGIKVRNRLLIMVVEGLRKSRDFQRSDVIKAVRTNVLDLMKKELPHDTELWKALTERQREEDISLSPPTKIH